MDEIDPYAALGVSRTATEDEIRTSYRRLARQYHPDVNPNDKTAEDRFKEISYAYDVLSDPEKRTRYDEFGAAGLQPGFDPEQARAYRRWSEGARRSPFHQDAGEEIDLEELFGRMTGRRGGGFEGFARARHRGRDVQADVTVDFLDAVLGRELRLDVPGRGALRVRIPAGANEGTRVRLAGQGEPGPTGAPSGDLYLTLHVRPHPYFRREGDDLSLELPVTIPELVLGAAIEVPTPDGVATVRVPPHARPGQRLRLRGKGAARRGTTDRGDLYLRLVVELPEGRDAELEELAKGMEPLYADRDPRAALKDGRTGGSGR
ncbi:DnaJ domain-containing protein [Myxococcota bacterium]|nr:DnaJ domain-containing protein [Myxococcota bacterium]